MAPRKPFLFRQRIERVWSNNRKSFGNTHPTLAKDQWKNHLTAFYSFSWASWELIFHHHSLLPFVLGKQAVHCDSPTVSYWWELFFHLYPVEAGSSYVSNFPIDILLADWKDS